MSNKASAANKLQALLLNKILNQTLLIISNNKEVSGWIPLFMFYTNINVPKFLFSIND